MKELTQYITEKASFLIKKHIVKNKNVITNSSAVKNGMYYKLERNDDNFVLGKIVETGDVIKTFEETGKEILKNEYVVTLGHQNRKHLEHPVIYMHSYGAIDNFVELTDNDWEIIKDIEDCIANEPRLKPGYQIGIVVDDKFIPNDDETNNKLYN